MTQVHDTQSVQVITAELVAKVVAGISQIGYARAALETAGCTATIVANRITVNGAIEALLILANGAGLWRVYAVDGASPVWTVGTHPIQENSSSSWIGCVE
ncbi:MAG: hypothetical protein QOE61_2120 [Micromonosporaceae bacterium]|jgi:hypothetical protein|nr:hypothetical protein [Micromonosporaceae bacterium]MDT5148468.1 hypothetical protein [Mycobacterium sp.]